MSRDPYPACQSDLACFRNDGHTGNHAYPLDTTKPQPVSQPDTDRLAALLAAVRDIIQTDYDETITEWRALAKAYDAARLIAAGVTLAPRPATRFTDSDHNEAPRPALDTALDVEWSRNPIADAKQSRLDPRPAPDTLTPRSMETVRNWMGLDVWQSLGHDFTEWAGWTADVWADMMAEIDPRPAPDTAHAHDGRDHPECLCPCCINARTLAAIVADATPYVAALRAALEAER